MRKGEIIKKLKTFIPFLVLILFSGFTHACTRTEPGVEEIDVEITVEPKIIFTSYRDINSEIYIMNVDGSEQINLTNNPADDYGPCFSPDGSKIAFVSHRDENWEIYVMDSDGKNQVRLTNNDSVDSEPLWSPDGSSIAFKSDRDGNREIYIMNSDGSGQRKLSNNNFTVYSFSWSPDGSKIAFMSSRGGNYEIYLMNVDGSGQTRLTDNPAEDASPCFSPDGSKIAFVSYRDGNQEIYIMNVDGSEQTNLTNNPELDYMGWDYGPCFSPNGSKIAFMSHRDGRDAEIYIMNTDGSDQSRLTNNQAYDTTPCFSSDGSKIAFESYRGGRGQEIYIMNVDGSEQTRLTDNTVEDTTPCFSPEGAMIFIASDYESKEEGKAQVHLEYLDEDEICIEVSERSPHNVIEAELVYCDEDTLFEESDLIFEGVVIDEKEIGMKEYIDGELRNTYYSDVFTFKINKIYYTEDSSIKNGDIIRIANGSCSNEWIRGTIEMKKGNEYIVLTQKVHDTSTVEFSKCSDYFVSHPWMAIISIERGDYLFDEEFTSLKSGVKEEIIREDNGFETKIYRKGKEFEKELEYLISEKKGKS